MASRMSIGELLRGGLRAVSKYMGTVLSVFVVQSLLALACMLGMAILFAQQFAHLPLFDEAVDGDLVALVWCLRAADSTLLAIAGIAAGGLLLWELVAWFLVGGLAGVFAQQPEGRGDTARCFGASGATTYLAYARLAVMGLPGILLALFAWVLGLGVIVDRIEYALTLPQLFGPIVLASLPALLLLHFFATVMDYARIELTLRHDSHAPGVITTYLRSLVWVAKRPRTLVHAGIGWVLFLLVTLAYVYLAHGHPMYGAGGAITLFFVRQGVALLRMAIRVTVFAGQVELGRTRPLPPRRVEVKAEPKA